jgi:hypothetical protein
MNILRCWTWGLESLECCARTDGMVMKRNKREAIQVHHIQVQYIARPVSVI